jgi:acyl-CoA thioester hydrolase
MEYANLKALKWADFPLCTFDKIRYADTDRQGHVNNAVFHTCFETGRVELVYDPQKPLYDPDGSFVIAHANVDYVGEIHWPGTVEIGTGIARIGTSSIRVLQGLFQDGTLVATSETVIVHVDQTTKKSKPLSEDTRESLMRVMFAL